MRELRVHQSLFTAAARAEETCRVIQVEDKPFASGAFGAVYRGRCSEFSRLELAVKVFTRAPHEQRLLLDNIQSLQSALATKAAADGRSISGVGSLDCAPLLSFEGTLGGQPALGYATRYIAPADARSFEDLLGDQTAGPTPYSACSLSTRLKLMLELASGMALLRQVGYIHADINVGNLLIDVNRGRLFIIDFDAGVVTRRSDDEPLTWGKPDDWVAPEINEQLIVRGDDRVRVSLFTDLWAVSVGMHYLLTTAGPFYFLKNLSPTTVKKYLSQHEWPSIDRSSPLFEKSSQRTVDALTQYFQQNDIFRALLPHFRQAFVQGYARPEERITYTQWQSIIQQLLTTVAATASQGQTRKRRQRKERRWEKTMGTVVRATRMAARAALQQLWLFAVWGLTVAIPAASKKFWRGLTLFLQSSTRTHVTAGIYALALSGIISALVDWVEDAEFASPQAASAVSHTEKLLPPSPAKPAAETEGKKSSRREMVRVSSPMLNLRANSLPGAFVRAVLYKDTLLLPTGHVSNVGNARWIEVNLANVQQSACVNVDNANYFLNSSANIMRGSEQYLYGQTCEDITFTPVSTISGWVNAQFVQ